MSQENVNVSPLGGGEKNYLELYGIFPSLSVMRERFVTDDPFVLEGLATPRILEWNSVHLS